MDAVDVARYARHIALPEIGPAGQARICAARVGIVGSDLAAETAAIYLKAAGVEQLFPLPPGGEGQGEGVPAFLSTVDLIVRSGFDDTPLDAEAACKLAGVSCKVLAPLPTLDGAPALEKLCADLIADPALAPAARKTLQSLGKLPVR